MRTTTLCVALLAVSVLFTSQLAAQPPFQGTYQRPTISPYLNLGNANQNGISNYFTLVRPQIEQQKSQQQAQNQIRQIQRQQQIQATSARNTNPQGNPVIRSTGHQTQFMFLSHYYNVNTSAPRSR